MNPVPPPTPPFDDAAMRFGRPLGGWRLKLYTVIFEADTRAGRLFDLALIWLILTSVGVVVLDSFEAMHARWGTLLEALEWFFTLTFTLEYIARLVCVRRPSRYARPLVYASRTRLTAISSASQLARWSKPLALRRSAVASRMPAWKHSRSFRTTSTAHTATHRRQERAPTAVRSVAATAPRW